MRHEVTVLSEMIRRANAPAQVISPEQCPRRRLNRDSAPPALSANEADGDPHRKLWRWRRQMLDTPLREPFGNQPVVF
jgi:hypothetical protein